MNLSSKGININRIRNVDLVESIAIIFVVMYHSSNYSVDFLTGGTWLARFRIGLEQYCQLVYRFSFLLMDFYFLIKILF